MQILHPFPGTVQQYEAELSDPERYRPRHCPQCAASRPLTAHGFYQRTLEDVGFEGVIRVRRYLCASCQRTVSLLPEFALPYLRSSIVVIALFLVARLLAGQTLKRAAATPTMAYQRGQFWVRRFRRRAEALCASLAGLTKPTPASGFVERATGMLETTGWISAHRFLFGQLREHLLGWPRRLAPAGCGVTISPAPASG
jgi:transposase-like protein